MELRLTGIRKRYGDREVVSGVDLRVPEGELLALLGPSGCGKTTTLRMVAGHERPDSGRIQLGGTDVTGSPPEERDIGMVFQSYALFPHLSVFANVAFGLRMRRVAADEERSRVAEALALVGLEGTGRRRVTNLSGGEQQRVALARALVLRPALLCLDEPLSNLDAALRAGTRREIRRIQRAAGLTTLYVTHDQEEALSIADIVAVMESGRIRRCGPPQEVYEEPRDAFVAGFIGDANVLRGTVRDGLLRFGEGAELPAPPGTEPGTTIAFALRRESIRIRPGDDGAVSERQFQGDTWHVLVTWRGVPLRVRHPAAAGAPPAPGERCSVEIPADAIRPLRSSD